MRTRIWASMAVVFLLAALLAAQTAQQGSSGAITGTLRSVAGAALPGVNVAAIGPSPSLARRMLSATRVARSR